MSSLLPFVIIGLTSGSVYGLAGVGLVLTYKTSGLFNFAHGTVAAALAYAFYDLHVRHHVPWPVALPFCVVVLGGLAGLGLERMARRLADAPAASKVVATLGLVIAIQELASIRYGAATLRFPAFLPTRAVRVLFVNVGVDQLIVMAVALAATVALSLLLRSSRLGMGMRGVVDNGELLSLAGADPVRVRRWSWCIGSCFAGLSGILLAPAIGLDATILTLLVVQAFGAAAVGLFTSLPLTYAGGLLVGVAASVSTKYVGSIPALGGLPPSMPFVVLFAVLVLVPRHTLKEIAVERQRRVGEQRAVPKQAKAALGGCGALVLVVLPSIAGTRLLVYTNGFVLVILFLSLALLERLSGQVSLAQLAFAAVGAAGFAHLSAAGVPWLAAVVVGGLIAVPVGAAIAIPAIRLSGLYLALATFGFGILMERMAFGTSLMFGSAAVPLVAPRPSIATSDTAYYAVVVAFVAAAVALVVAVHRSRLGRLLRAMADEQTALTSFGTNVTVIKVVVFAVSAFLAGIAGALTGPITGAVAGASFGSFSSLLLVVVLALQGRARDVSAAFGAAVTMAVLPSLLDGTPVVRYLTPTFGVAAIAVALFEAGGGAEPPRWIRTLRAGAAERTDGPAFERRVAGGAA